VRHVAPHRWADALAGRLSPVEAGAMAAHADGCTRCARARDRITAGRAAFGEIKTGAMPEVKWDRVRAQVYWETSSQMRMERLKQPRERASFAVPLASVAAVAALVAAVASGSVPRNPFVDDPFEAPPVVAADTGDVGVLTLVRGDATIDGRPALEAFATALQATSEIRTGSGEVSVQFGDGSAFAVGPRSVLRVRQFDRHAIALEIDGRIDVDVAPRAPGQRFVVLAGSRTVEVRGTGFRVERTGDAVAVSCRHGRVAVRDDAGEVEVRAGEGVEVATGSRVEGTPVRALADDELVTLAAAAPHRLAVWASPDAVTALTAALTVEAPADRGVRVDGAMVGRGPLTVRVVSGRHLVETEEASEADGWASAGWVDVRGGAIEVAAAPEDTVEPVSPTPLQGTAPRPDLSAGKSLRRKQLGKQLGDVRHCARALHKQGIDDTYVELELSVDARGAVRYANLLATDLPPTAAQCVRDAVAEMRFPAGPAATWRETIRP
jgi:hypothetical protein